MKVDFMSIETVGLDGTKGDPIETCKAIARIVYNKTKNLDLVDTAFKIHKGEVVDLETSDISEIRRLLDDPENQVFAFFKKAVFEYLDEVLKKRKDELKKQDV